MIFDILEELNCSLKEKYNGYFSEIKVSESVFTSTLDSGYCYRTYLSNSGGLKEATLHLSTGKIKLICDNSEEIIILEKQIGNLQLKLRKLKSE